MKGVHSMTKAEVEAEIKRLEALRVVIPGDRAAADSVAAGFAAKIAEAKAEVDRHEAMQREREADLVRKIGTNPYSPPGTALWQAWSYVAELTRRVGRTKEHAEAQHRLDTIIRARDDARNSILRETVVSSRTTEQESRLRDLWESVALRSPDGVWRDAMETWARRCARFELTDDGLRLVGEIPTEFWRTMTESSVSTSLRAELDARGRRLAMFQNDIAKALTENPIFHITPTAFTRVECTPENLAVAREAYDEYRKQMEAVK